jgi:P22_AR N-terminal domain
MGTEQPRIYRTDEQEIVMFHGRPIVAVRLDDGRIVVTLQSLCEGMGLNTQAQVRRIERTEALTGEVAYPWFETTYGPQEQAALVLDVLPGWLMGVDTRRIKGETHDTILAYQREAYAVLYQHFATHALALPAPASTLAPADPQRAGQVAEIAAQLDTLTGAVNLMREHLAALLALPEQVAGIAGQLDETRALIETLATRQDTADTQIARIDERTQRLTPAHARAIQEQVDRMARETKRLEQPLTYAIIYGRLKHQFRASTYREIADEQYPAVMAYLQDELRRALAGEGPAQGSLF